MLPLSFLISTVVLQGISPSSKHAVSQQFLGVLLSPLFKILLKEADLNNLFWKKNEC